MRKPRFGEINTYNPWQRLEMNPFCSSTCSAAPPHPSQVGVPCSAGAPRVGSKLTPVLFSKMQLEAKEAALPHLALHLYK